MAEENWFVKCRRYIAGFINPGPAPQEDKVSPRQLYSPEEQMAGLAGDHTAMLTGAVQDLQRSRGQFETGINQIVGDNYGKVLEELGRMRADQRAHVRRVDDRYAAFEARTVQTVREGVADAKGYADRQVADAVGRSEASLGERVERARADAAEDTALLRRTTAESVGALGEQQAETARGLAATQQTLWNCWKLYNSRAGITGPEPTNPATGA